MFRNQTHVTSPVGFPAVLAISLQCSQKVTKVRFRNTGSEGSPIHIFCGFTENQKDTTSLLGWGGAKKDTQPPFAFQKIFVLPPESNEVHHWTFLLG